MQEEEKAQRMNSALEGTVLAVLCISLYLVLRRRRVLRAAATSAGPAGMYLCSTLQPVAGDVGTERSQRLPLAFVGLSSPDIVDDDMLL